MTGIDEESGKVIATFHAYDQDDLELYSHAIGYKLALFDITQRLRYEFKHKELGDEARRIIEELKDFIAELTTQYHLPED